jgi:hypothetical protein
VNSLVAICFRVRHSSSARARMRRVSPMSATTTLLIVTFTYLLNETSVWQGVFDGAAHLRVITANRVIVDPVLGDRFHMPIGLWCDGIGSP